VFCCLPYNTVKPVNGGCTHRSATDHEDEHHDEPATRGPREEPSQHAHCVLVDTKINMSMY
jgi:hypothetical protein